MRKLLLVSFCICLAATSGGFAFGQADRLIKSIGLQSAERRELDQSLPSRIRTFLETAEEFVIFAQLRIENGKLVPEMDRELVPNFKAVISGTDQRRAVLKTLYSEASKGHQPAICYLPSHSLIAQKGTEQVKVEICFGCRRFYVSGSLGEFKGTLARRD